MTASALSHYRKYLSLYKSHTAHNIFFALLASVVISFVSDKKIRV